MTTIIGAVDPTGAAGGMQPATAGAIPQQVSYGPVVTNAAPAPTPTAGVATQGTAGMAPAGQGSGFHVRLSNFTGPFDLLLTLIGKHQLEITELALSQVTDEFIAYIRGMGDDWSLDEVSEFVVVAATLLDLKAARLLPAAEVEDEEDLALLEARDLLFARLLQYKAFKEAAAHIAGRDALFSRTYPRSVTLERQYTEVLPELVLGIGAHRLAQLAARALSPKVPPQVSMAHLHQVRVSVREHAAILREKLLRLRTATFRTLCADCETTLEVVARFLALLELYREGLVIFEQVTPLGELTVRWVGDESAGTELAFDEYGDAEPIDEPVPAGGGAPGGDAPGGVAPGGDAPGDGATGPQSEHDGADDEGGEARR